MIVHSKTGSVSDDSKPKKPATGSVYEPTAEDIMKECATLREKHFASKRESTYPPVDGSPVDRPVYDIWCEEEDE